MSAISALTRVSTGRWPDTFSGIASWIFAALLCAYTVCTQDGGDIAPRIISVLLLTLAAVVLLFNRSTLRITFPLGCLLAMSAYGVIQTLWFPHKIAAYGWSGTLFWFTAACIVLLAQILFGDLWRADQFRWIFVVFGSAICIVDLLGQASQLDHYFWLFPSHYGRVYGPFAYWNNFAQFVELLLPVTLWLGLAGRKPDVRYLLLAAVQLGAATASASRAGSLLTVAELVAILGIIFLKNRNRSFLYAAIATILVSLLFVYSAGVSNVVQKLERKDQLAQRRQINQSSLAMIEAQPLTGWGLDTYVPVYRMFAVFDDGNYVNRAHNDWFQWAAEGGLLFPLCFSALFLWSIKPALRSVWAVGVLALCIHAFVDYPFARFGVCAWYFALVGLLCAPSAVHQK